MTWQIFGGLSGAFLLLAGAIFIQYKWLERKTQIIKHLEKVVEELSRELRRKQEQIDKVKKELEKANAKKDKLAQAGDAGSIADELNKL
jgi:predicted RNase H-like nuclease (RuvC/YqgF family)